MYHDELSQVMAQKGVFGLGDWLVEQVAGKPNAAKVIKAYEQNPLPAMPIIREDNAESIPLSAPESSTVRRDNNV
jgi:Rod binding domain-containing protein